MYYVMEIEKNYSTADEQPQGDSILTVRNIVYSAMVTRLILHK